MKREKKRLGDILVQAGMITPDQLAVTIEAQKKTNERLGKTLIRMGFITEENLIKTLAHQLKINFVNLKEEKIDPSLAKLIPDKIARRHTVVPLARMGQVLMIAMADPLNIFALDDLAFKTGLEIEPVIASEKDILHTLDTLYETTLMDKIESAPEDLQVFAGEEEAGETEVGTAEVDEGPISQLVNLIISEAIKDRCSDIHLEPEERALRIRYRIDGILRETSSLGPRFIAPVISRIKIMSKMDIAEKRYPQDGRFKFVVDNKVIDSRVSTFPTIYGENVVMRILDQSSIIIRLEDLGFLPRDMEKIRYLIQKPYGFILVTGPTGSGKTTTLYAILNTINSPEKHIVTLEDPVEYRLDLIRQCQINVKAGLTFAVGLRSILRQDPDGIMVGEIRDFETAEIAVQSALTGHLVLSTLHTNDAPSSLVRLTDMGVDPFLISSSVEGVLAQRLVRVICPRCKEPYPASGEDLVDLRLPPNQEVVLHKGKGCSFCKGSGYKGRLGIFEILIVDKELKEMILRKATQREIEDYARQKQQMKSLREDGISKVLAGITTVEELNRVTPKEATFV
ncbi:MAG: Flp pilus assembly complex ATPase component TadA [Deltaproteobacteria bacterium]|nr:Flp pilus assembly complex ATPase component TadA [Deltaproteobacteria bacterium]